MDKDSERVEAARAKAVAWNEQRGIFRQKIHDGFHSLRHDFIGRRDHIDSWKESLVILWWACGGTVLYLGEFLEAPLKDPAEATERERDDLSSLLASIFSFVCEVSRTSEELDRPLRRLIELNLPQNGRRVATGGRSKNSGDATLRLWTVEGPKLLPRLAEFTTRPKTIGGLALTLVHLHADCLGTQEVLEELSRASGDNERIHHLCRLLALVERVQASSRFASRKINLLFGT